jgi:hypothetical protein
MPVTVVAMANKDFGRGHIEETGNLNATAEKNRRFQAGNWFPDYQAHTEET